MNSKNASHKVSPHYSRRYDQKLWMGGHGVAGRVRHFNTNFLVEGDGDKANLKAYLMLTRGLGQEPVITTCNDDVVKVNGKSQFPPVVVFSGNRQTHRPREWR